MASTQASMVQYALTLNPPSSITQAVVGQFSGTKEQQILTASGSRITLHRPEPALQKVSPILTHDIFGIVRAVAAFRLAGSIKDFVVVSSDSGRIAILEYMSNQNKFVRLHLETYGKSGTRRVIPGQYLAADPKGRACMLASVEKNKLVYVLNRNAQAELTISSPLEAHKPQTLVFAMVAMDVGYENPSFAALEIDYGDSDQDPSGEAYENIEKQLVFYELDLGLNHVVRKWSDTVDRTSNMLFQVPGGSDGPSGVLVCGEDNITYRNSNQDAHRVAIPRRRGVTEDPARKRHIVAGVMHKMKGGDAFFFLLQTEDGDVFKLTVEMVHDGDGRLTGEVSRMRIKYFDTLPLSTNLLILRSGFLFLASEFGNHSFYQFEKLDDDETEFLSDDFPSDPLESYEPVYFHPRPLDNLNLVESKDSMHPLMGCKVTTLSEDGSAIIASICGESARSSFKILKHGLTASEAVESRLPSMPTAVWSTKLHKEDEFDTYIVLSFSDATLILKIGENVEEVTDTGFLTSVPTMAVQLLGEDALVQIHPRGIRHIRPNGSINEWPSPQHRTIVASSTNERQVVVALSSGELTYFEMDEDGSLAEYEIRREMSGTVTAISLGEVPEGRVRSQFLAVGCDDNTVRILSLDPDSTLENKSVQALSSPPSALNIMPMPDSSSGGQTMYLHIGLQSGVYLRTVLDEVSGELSDTRTRFLGPQPIKLFRVWVKGQQVVLALSSRAWLGYSDPQTQAFMLTPLDYAPLEWAWNFTSEQFPEGMVGIQGPNLRIFWVDNLSSNILQESIPLAHTPRKFVKHFESPYFYVAEAEYNTLSSAATQRLRNDSNLVNGDAAVLPAEDFGYPRSKGHWSSCIQIVDPLYEKKILETIDLEEDECATSIASVPFVGQDGEHFLVVGIGKDVLMSPFTHKGGFISIYRYQEDGKTLEFMHKTSVEAPPRALLAFQGRLLAGVGPDLRLYDLGMKQLLRKTQARVVPNLIVDMQTQGSRIIISDIVQSVFIVVYKHEENLLIPFADDVIPRHVTCTTMLDYQTIAGGDKFGNVWILRCPTKTSEAADEAGSGTHLVNQRPYLQGTPDRLNSLCHFYTQDIPTSIQRCQLAAGGREILLWSGLQGTLGFFVPFTSRDDVEFFQSLEQQMRAEDPPLAGRDHLIYRGYYAPVKAVIDGDLCERFTQLPMDTKARIAGEMDRSVREIERKIGDTRTRFAY